MTRYTKPRIPAKMVAAGLAMLAENPRLAGRIEKAALIATNLRQINPAYRATASTCHCPDSLFAGRNRGSLSVCKHSLGLRLAAATFEA